MHVHLRQRHLHPSPAQGDLRLEAQNVPRPQGHNYRLCAPSRHQMRQPARDAICHLPPRCQPPLELPEGQGKQEGTCFNYCLPQNKDFDIIKQ